MNVSGVCMHTHAHKHMYTYMEACIIDAISLLTQTLFVLILYVFVCFDVSHNVHIYTFIPTVRQMAHHLVENPDTDLTSMWESQQQSIQYELSLRVLIS